MNPDFRENYLDVFTCTDNAMTRTNRNFFMSFASCSDPRDRDVADVVDACVVRLQALNIPGLSTINHVATCRQQQFRDNIDTFFECYNRGLPQIRIYAAIGVSIPGIPLKQDSYLDEKFLNNHCYPTAKNSLVEDTARKLSCLRYHERRCPNIGLPIYTLLPLCEDAAFEHHLRSANTSCEWQDMTSEFSDYRRSIRWDRRAPYPNPPEQQLDFLDIHEILRFSTQGL
jgi:hypothetical protein